MIKLLWPKLLPHLIAVVCFIVVAVIYCRPVLSNQVLQQSDVTQWKAMSHNSFEYKEKEGHFPLWINNLFSGMPGYQVALDAENEFSPIWFYHLFTLFLPKPISYFFLACICFYFFTQVLRVNPWLGIIGGLAYGYATYNPIIVAVGHDTKMQSIALLPALIGSLLLIYEKKYLWGGLLTAIITALLVGFNHVQIIYYTLIIVAFLSVSYLVRWIKQKEWKHLALALSIALGAAVVGTLSNAVTLLTTLEYSKASIRGGSELPTKSTTQKGLSEDYAFDYSMYITEPFVLLVPKMYGGSDGMEVAEDKSKAIEQLRTMPPQLAQQLQGYCRFYWGGIGGTSGPPYAGAIICFLAIVGFCILDGKHKWWLLLASGLAIVMSWGGYFAGFNGILLKVLPMYNKFRAPSMIIVIPTFLFCVAAVLALDKLITEKDKTALFKQYKSGLLYMAGIFIALVLIYFNSDFAAAEDRQLLARVSNAPDQIKTYAQQFIAALKEDRKGLFLQSLLRSLFFVATGALLLWLTIKNKIKIPVLLGIIGVLAFVDVMAIDLQYLNSDNYQDATEYATSNFTPTPADQQISKDKSRYRVLDVRDGVHAAFNYSALSAYHHQSIGGYHPAKLSVYQDLIEYQLYNYPNCQPVLDMLNTKYIIHKDSTGNDAVITNTGALGIAWLVDTIQYRDDPRSVMDALTTLHPGNTAIVFAKDKKMIGQTGEPATGDTILLHSNRNDIINYRSHTAAARFAVFPEIYYQYGWKAYIDDEEAPIIRTNYALRGLVVPAGRHRIRFEFHPASFYTGRNIATVVGGFLYLLLLMAIFITGRQLLKSAAKS